ncbi:MAG: TPM domain-containing protein, partial [Elusimicrobiota bacterium]|nr:TPM domain-containing protein [Elusimicrobiota bacterium]
MNYFNGRARFLLPALLAALLACPALAASPEAPAPGSYVNDYAGVMEPQAAAKLNGVLAELDARAKAQVAVLTVKSLGGADIESYAVETYKKWGVGDKKTSRGVLLLVAVEDRKSRIEVGYGLEGILPDGRTGSVQDKYMVPFFKAGDYSSGISQGALALAALIAEDSGVALSAGFDRRARPQLPPLSRGQKIFLLLAIVGFILFSIKHPYLALFLLHAMMRSSGRGH